MWRVLETDDLEKIIEMIRLMTPELAIPSRPDFGKTEVEKLACCSGEWHECLICKKGFKRFCKLMQHKRDVHESGRFRCVCGKEFPGKRNWNRHVQKSCKRRAKGKTTCRMMSTTCIHDVHLMSTTCMHHGGMMSTTWVHHVNNLDTYSILLILKGILYRSQCTEPLADDKCFERV